MEKDHGMGVPPPQGPPPPYGMNAPPPAAAPLPMAGGPAVVYAGHGGYYSLQQPMMPSIGVPTFCASTMIVGGTANLGPSPTTVQCPSCHATVQTRVEHENGTKTHLFALLLCLIGCCPCAIIPYCTDSCRNANHYCSSCGAFLGTHQN